MYLFGTWHFSRNILPSFIFLKYLHNVGYNIILHCYLYFEPSHYPYLNLYLLSPLLFFFINLATYPFYHCVKIIGFCFVNHSEYIIVLYYYFLFLWVYSVALFLASWIEYIAHLFSIFFIFLICVFKALNSLWSTVLAEYHKFEHAILGQLAILSNLHENFLISYGVV